ncbi:MAG: LamG domain-containing protein [Opitutaceae bacterium]
MNPLRFPSSRDLRPLPLLTALALASVFPAGRLQADSETVALWGFDETLGMYPSHTLDTVEGLNAPLTMGLGARLIPGRYGNALSIEDQEPVDESLRRLEELFRHETGQKGPLDPSKLPEEATEFGLISFDPAKGRTVPPLSWSGAGFAALMTGGEYHLRKEVGYLNPTAGDLNLGDFDWTVELWFQPRGPTGESGVILEIGTGPRGENDVVTRLELNGAGDGFTLVNQPSATELAIASDGQALSAADGSWIHLAFVHDARANRVTHYVNGRKQAAPARAELKALPSGEEAYLSVGRDGLWNHPLPGAIDELRISRGRVYEKDFVPPGSLVPSYPEPELLAGPAPLFGKGAEAHAVIPLGGRKHLFIDAAFVADQENLTWVPNPPRKAERVMEGIVPPFRKHLTFVEDEDGRIRMFNGLADDYLGVRISDDGIHFEIPDTGIHHKGHPNIVIAESVGMGSPFIDPNGPPEHRWKYLSGYDSRGTYLYTSPDGWKWKRVRTAALSFRSGSQTSFFYDDQRQRYVAYQRTGFRQSAGGATQREFVMTTATDPYHPWPFTPQSAEEIWEIAKTTRLRPIQPWWLDNGPLTPGDFGIEYPSVFFPIDGFDPVGSGVYVPKAHKYPWAPDTYLAFPVMYFDYEEENGPPQRHVLMDPARLLGSGTVETQLAVSRDGESWKRFPRPAYVGLGDHGDREIHQAYMAEGMIRRGHEIWQYYYGTEIYHSTYVKEDGSSSVFRVVQELDRFVAVESPYDHYGYLTTRPFTFEGNRLSVNVDTDSLGYVQVGFIDEDGRPIPGFNLDDCIYLNGDFFDKNVEWLHGGSDVSALQGRTVQLVFRMRGSRLFGMQFLTQ